MCRWGLFRNFDLEAYDKREFLQIVHQNERNSLEYNPRTLGLYLQDTWQKEEEKELKIEGAQDLLSALVTMYYNAEAILHKEERLKDERVVVIPIPEKIDFYDLNLPQETQQKLLLWGKEAAKNAPQLQSKKKKVT